jgi:hypothetical protein
MTYSMPLWPVVVVAYVATEAVTALVVTEAVIAVAFHACTHG